MIQFIDISLRYGQKVLFDHFSWHIKPGSRISLIGPNGSGKTSLFRLAEGKGQPDSGKIVTSKNTVISVFHQIHNFTLDRSVLNTALGGNRDYASYRDQFAKIQQRLEEVDHNSPQFQAVLEAQEKLEEFAQETGIHETETRCNIILGGLGFSREQISGLVKSLSPGYQHRLALAIALLNPHNLLLLDEPTNHLDLESKAWLADYLKSSEKCFVLVTHDPEFMNQVTNTIGELTPGGVLEFQGTLEEFLEEKNEIHEKLQKQFAKEEAFLAGRREWIERFRSKATKAKQVQSQIKKLEKRETVAKPDDIFWNRETDYQFAYSKGSKLVLKMENGSYRYPGKNQNVFSAAELEISQGDKIALVGANGAGKSTLLNLLAGKTVLSDGTLNIPPQTVISVFSQLHSEELDEKKSLLDTVKDRYPDLPDVEARRILGFFGFSADSVFKQVSSLSGGEQSRLRLSMMIPSPCNLLLMDEPTNHLDLVTRNSLKNALAAFPGSLVVISHDPDFLSGLCNKTYRIENGNVENLNCSYEDFLQTSRDSSGKKEEKENNTGDFQKAKADKNRLKKIRSLIEKTETEIAGLEQEKQSLENTMHADDFYQSGDFQKTLDRYEAVKQEILEKMTEWENLESELG